MTGRLPCSVPFCKGSRGLRKADNGRMPVEWLCSRHWASVPYWIRKDYRRSVAKARANGEEASAQVADAIWAACKRMAIEREGGLE